MGKAIIQNMTVDSKYIRKHYANAFSDLRHFYAVCAAHQYPDDFLMIWKYNLWRKHGVYLDLAWQHHFALKVSEATGKGVWHGWLNIVRHNQYEDMKLVKGIRPAWGIPL